MTLPIDALEMLQLVNESLINVNATTRRVRHFTLTIQPSPERPFNNTFTLSPVLLDETTAEDVTEEGETK